MAIFSFVIGSIIGLFCALIGWAALGMTFLAGVGLYLSVSFSVGGLLILANMPTPRGSQSIEA